MKTRRFLILMLMAIILVLATLSVQKSTARAEPAAPVKKISLTGKIAKSTYGYVIRSSRGNAPSEIFTILNPEPEILDGLENAETVVAIEARIVSGDNLAIETIDGKAYPSRQQ